MFLKTMRRTGLPMARFFAGFLAGKLCLALDPNPVNAIAFAACVPVVLGYITSDWER